MPSILKLHSPNTTTLPIIYDSPHSGDEWPDSFLPILSRQMLRRGEDLFVEKLFDQAPLHHSYFLYALFPRYFIDLNRSMDDIDPALITENDAGLYLSPSEKSRFGHGLIWRLCPEGHLIYKAPLSSHEILRRITHYWSPYHEQLQKIYNRLHQEFEHVFHINCHSMPAHSVQKHKDGKPIDIVLGDRNGKSCSLHFRDFLCGVFTRCGLNVAVNKPYSGGQLISAYADPKKNRHSIQIEINRTLYVNEHNHRRSRHYTILKSMLTKIHREVVEFVRKEIKGS